jgi:hypothetical protein
MAAANVNILKEEMKDRYGKNWTRREDNSELQNYIIDADSTYKKDLMAKYWNTSLQFNRTIGKNFLLAYTNADDNNPLDANIKGTV